MARLVLPLPAQPQPENAMASTEPDYNHQLAIKLSRVLNLVVPNDLLAQRVTDLAKTNSLDGFTAGPSSRVTFVSLLQFFLCPAAKTFGKFKDSFLAELHAEIISHASQEAAGVAPQPLLGITVQDSDVLQPEPVRQGGLVRKDAVGACLITGLLS